MKPAAKSTQIFDRNIILILEILDRNNSYISFRNLFFEIFLPRGKASEHIRKGVISVASGGGQCLHLGIVQYYFKFS